MTQKGLGMTVIVETDGRLAGISPMMTCVAP